LRQIKSISEYKIVIPIQAPALHYREIRQSDLVQIANLLAEGFPRRSRAQWVAALEILQRRDVPDGCPRFGYMLEIGETAVGAILLIFARMPQSGTVRCNGAGWYVAPPFRSYGSLLLMQTLRYPAPRMNVSPALHTLPILEALGYERYCNGAFAAVAPFTAGVGKARVRSLRDIQDPENLIPAPELQLLVPNGGRLFPFYF
jgi:hypothetical protein